MEVIRGESYRERAKREFNERLVTLHHAETDVELVEYLDRCHNDQINRLPTWMRRGEHDRADAMVLDYWYGKRLLATIDIDPASQNTVDIYLTDPKDGTSKILHEGVPRSIAVFQHVEGLFTIDQQKTSTLT